MHIRLRTILSLSLALLLPSGVFAAEPPAGSAEAAAEAAAEAVAEAASAPPCTAPSQDGCETCCRPLENGQCTELSWTGGPDSKAKPWYNARRAMGKACPPDCRKCAECLDRDRETLEKLKRPDDCVCEERDLGVDPCHAPMSCECFCSRYARLAAMCVDAKPDRLAPTTADDDAAEE